MKDSPLFPRSLRENCLCCPFPYWMFCILDGWRMGGSRKRKHVTRLPTVTHWSVLIASRRKFPLKTLWQRAQKTQVKVLRMITSYKCDQLSWRNHCTCFFKISFVMSPKALTRFNHVSALLRGCEQRATVSRVGQQLKNKVRIIQFMELRN